MNTVSAASTQQVLAKSADPFLANSFDALRLLAASAVLFSHQFSLLGQAQPFTVFGRTLGEIAVDVFFSISGYLVLGSWLSDPSLWRFAVKRVLRLYPALIAVLVLSALMVGPMVSALPLHDYLAQHETWFYLTQNLSMHIVYRLPLVFAQNPFPDAVNGSLWTLPYELRWYLILALIGLSGLLRFRTAVLILWAGVFINYYFVYNLDAHLKLAGDHRWADEFGTYFVAGMALYSVRAYWLERRLHLLLAAIFCGAALFLSQRPNATLAVIIPVLSVTLGMSQSRIAAWVAGFGDLSYGIYLYAFPVQQTVVWYFGMHSAYGLLAIAVPLTALLAFLSWHLVEHPAIRLKRHAAFRRT